MPETLYDPDFCGIERHTDKVCDHWKKLMKYVAFEGPNTGRRFLGCARAVSNFSFLLAVIVSVNLSNFYADYNLILLIIAAICYPSDIVCFDQV